MPKSKKEVTTPSIRILQVNSCPSNSGKSTLTYQIGCNDESDIFLHVYSNDGGGFFSTEWVDFNDIHQVLDEAVSEGSAITSFVLYSLFTGKSVNTPAFLLAALRNEKLVEPMEDNSRHHVLLDPVPFIEKVDKLAASKVNLKADSKPIVKKKTSKKKVSKKTVTKKRSTASK